MAGHRRHLGGCADAGSDGIRVFFQCNSEGRNEPAAYAARRMGTHRLDTSEERVLRDASSMGVEARRRTSEVRA
jgi:hypothetical protein